MSTVRSDLVNFLLLGFCQSGFGSSRKSLKQVLHVQICESRLYFFLTSICRGSRFLEHALLSFKAVDNILLNCKKTCTHLDRTCSTLLSAWPWRSLLGDVIIWLFVFRATLWLVISSCFQDFDMVGSNVQWVTCFRWGDQLWKTALDTH